MPVSEISCIDAFELLKNNKNTILIDVRTKEETSFVGIVDASSFDNRLILLPWKIFPDMKLNREFGESLQAILHKIFGTNFKEEVKVLFLCRSGARSEQAAYFAENEGYKNCLNIIYGFEGDLNDKKQRGKINGWKADNLPWIQS